MKKLYLFALLFSLGCGKSENKSDISEKLRTEIAVAQRDYFIAKTQFDPAFNKFREITMAGEKACAAVNKMFAPETVTCKEIEKTNKNSLPVK